jgi:hypothetical protein
MRDPAERGELGTTVTLTGEVALAEGTKDEDGVYWLTVQSDGERSSDLGGNIDEPAPAGPTRVAAHRIRRCPNGR